MMGFYVGEFVFDGFYFDLLGTSSAPKQDLQKSRPKPWSGEWTIVENMSKCLFL